MRTHGTPRVAAALLAGVLAASALVAGCASTDDAPDPDPSPAPAASGGTGTGAGPSGRPGPGQPEDLDVALSEPAEDSVYPHVGDPGVDALHYDLTLDWDPVTRTLTGGERLRFRAATTAPEVRLDLAPALRVSSVLLDGAEARFTHRGKDLVVREPVEEDDRHVLEVEYAGTPEPAAAPTTRGDFSTTGWTTTADGETWTMQEPFGAYTWYAVNDHPSDKALYDFTLTVPSPGVGVANGELTSRTEAGGTTRTTWRLAEPAASYLVTVATGEMVVAEDESASGVPITLWTPVGEDRFARRVGRTAEALDWAEERLGPYPFDTLGVVVVDSESGMESQTMITLGDTDYTTSMPVLVHEIVHHWYGNQVTPTDWRDVWMNEGMAMYLQGVWEAEDGGQTVDAVMDWWAGSEEQMRRESGPPADYDPARFGESNIYYGPALMWHEVRERLGDEEFWRLVRAWPAARDNAGSDYDDLTTWWVEESGADLRPLFDAWLLGETTPPR